MVQRDPDCLAFDLLRFGGKGYRAWLPRQGYTPQTVRKLLQYLGKLLQEQRDRREELGAGTVG